MTVRVQKESLNLREELSKLNKPSGVAGEAMLRAETPQEQFNLIGAGRKNLIINGDFQVSQRGDYSSATGHTSGAYFVDRWWSSHGSSATVQRQEVTLPNGDNTYSIKQVSTGAYSNHYLSFKQVVEDYKALSGKTITISAWVRTNIPEVQFRHDSTVSFGDFFPSDGEWHFVSETYTCPTITSAGRSANQTTFALINYGTDGTGIAVDDYLEVAQVQLELGSVATPFEHRSYGEELALCQRYFTRKNITADEEILTGYNLSTTVYYATASIPVPLRTTPSVTLSGTSGSYRFRGAGVNVSQTSVTFLTITYGANSNTVGVDVTCSGLSSTPQVYTFTSTANTTLDFDAEL